MWQDIDWVVYKINLFVTILSFEPINVLSLMFNYIKNVVCDENIDWLVWKNCGCLSQFVLTTKQPCVLNYFDWRYLLMFIRFTFYINRTKFYYLLTLKDWLWTYNSEKSLVSFSGDKPLITCWTVGIIRHPWNSFRIL